MSAYQTFLEQYPAFAATASAYPAEYLAIFTANASVALKLVGESYPFSNGSYLLTFENHNSVSGIRKFAHSRGAQVTAFQSP